jgi:hypothetical protein
LDSDLSKSGLFEDTEEVRGLLDFFLSHGREVLLVMNKKE